MRKYIVYINNDQSHVTPKELATPAFTKEMKKKGFRKHHVEVEAESEKDAMTKLHAHSEEYFNSLKELSGNAVICAICCGMVAVIYLIRS